MGSCGLSTVLRAPSIPASCFGHSGAAVVQVLNEAGSEGDAEARKLCRRRLVREAQQYCPIGQSAEAPGSDSLENIRRLPRFHAAADKHHGEETHEHSGDQKDDADL